MKKLRFSLMALGFLLTSGLLILISAVNYKSQPPIDVEPAIRARRDSEGRDCLDVYIKNKTNNRLILSEDISTEHDDIYGGVWFLSDKSIKIVHHYSVEWHRQDIDFAKKYPNVVGCIDRFPPYVRILPGETVRVSTIYLVSTEQNSPSNLGFQLGYQSGRELEESWMLRFKDKNMFNADIFDKIFERFPIHHFLLRRKTIWSNEQSIRSVRQTDLFGKV